MSISPVGLKGAICCPANPIIEDLTDKIGSVNGSITRMEVSFSSTICSKLLHFISSKFDSRALSSGKIVDVELVEILWPKA